MQAISRRISSCRASSSSASTFSCNRNVNLGVSSTSVPTTRDSTCLSKNSRKAIRQERRIMVKTLVDEYRAANAGKFPTLAFLRREIGGSQHILREILQELKYKWNHGIYSSIPDDHMGEAQDEDSSVVPCKTSHFRDAQELGTVDASEISLSTSSKCCGHRDLVRQMPKTFDHSDEAYNQVAEGFNEEIRESNNAKTFVISDYVEELCDRVKENNSACSGRTHDQMIDNGLNHNKEDKVLSEVLPARIVAKEQVVDGGDTRGSCNDTDPHKENITRKVEGEEPMAENPSIWGNFTSMARGMFSFLKL